MTEHVPIITDAEGREEGSIGIGAMIVFIALILVAAVASTIIIKTAEELQQRAEKTADDTRGDISGKVNVVDAFVNSSSSNNVTGILTIMQLAAGADEVTSDKISYFITCGTDDGVGIDTGTIDSQNGSMIADDDALNASSLDAGDTFDVVIPLNNCPSQIGDKIDMLIIVEGGGETTVELEVTSVTVGKTLI
jgi:flagellin FlaB